MGVVKLAGYARNKAGLGPGDLQIPVPIGTDKVQNAESLEALPPPGEGLTFYVDGWSFKYAPDVDTRSEMTGSYAAYETWLREHLSWLREMHGATIHIVWDGEASELKDATKNSRLSARELDALRLYDWVHAPEYNFIPAARSDMEADELTSTTYSCSIQGVSMSQAAGEAELEIVSRVRAHNAAAGRDVAFALGNDSDYLVMRACPYIQMGDLLEIDGRLHAQRVWRRSATALALGFVAPNGSADEDALVEFCLALGNDFLHEDVDRSRVFISPNESCLGPVYEACKDAGPWSPGLKDLIREAGPGVRLYSDVRAVEQRLQYSRAFYNTGFIDPERAPAGGDDDDDDEEEEEEEEEEMEYFIEWPEKEDDTQTVRDCFRWLSSKQKRLITDTIVRRSELSTEQVGRTVVDLLLHSQDGLGCLNPEGRMANEEQCSVLVDMLSLMHSPERQEELAEALAAAEAGAPRKPDPVEPQRVLCRFFNTASGCRFGVNCYKLHLSADDAAAAAAANDRMPPQTAGAYALRWPNVLCALRYQQIVGTVVRRIYRWDREHLASRFFSGPLFHYLMHRRQLATEANTEAKKGAAGADPLTGRPGFVVEPHTSIYDLPMIVDCLTTREEGTFKADDFPLHVAGKRARIVYHLLAEVAASQPSERVRITTDVAEAQAHLAEYIVLGESARAGLGRSILIFASHKSSVAELTRQLGQYRHIEVVKADITLRFAGPDPAALTPQAKFEFYRQRLVDLDNVPPHKFRVIVMDSDFQFNEASSFSSMCAVVDLGQSGPSPHIELASMNRSNARLARFSGRLSHLPRYLLAPYRCMRLSDVPESRSLYMRLDAQSGRDKKAWTFRGAIEKCPGGFANLSRELLVAPNQQPTTPENECGFMRVFKSTADARAAMRTLVEYGEIPVARHDGRLAYHPINFAKARPQPHENDPATAADSREAVPEDASREAVRAEVEAILADGIAAALLQAHADEEAARQAWAARVVVAHSPRPAVPRSYSRELSQRRKQLAREDSMGPLPPPPSAPCTVADSEAEKEAEADGLAALEAEPQPDAPPAEDYEFFVDEQEVESPRDDAWDHVDELSFRFHEQRLQQVSSSAYYDERDERPQRKGAPRYKGRKWGGSKR